MRISLLLILFFQFQIACAQADYRFYYKQTQLAEESLLNEEFALSLKHYDSAFNRYDFKFARDCYIAAQIAAYIERDSSTLKYLRYCVESGIRPACVSDSKVFEQFKRTRYWVQLNKDFPLSWKKYTSRIDTNLLNEFIARLEHEQQLKSTDESVSRRHYSNFVNQNISRITQLLHENTFPGEQTIGIANTIRMTAIFYPNAFSIATCHYGCHMVLPTLQHYNYSYFLLKDELTEAMIKGLINPRELVTIFLFTKYKICKPEDEKPNLPDFLADSIAASKIVFNEMLDKNKVGMDTANYYRDQWFIPRLGTKLEPYQLLNKYGIQIEIGEW